MPVWRKCTYSDDFVQNRISCFSSFHSIRTQSLYVSEHSSGYNMPNPLHVIVKMVPENKSEHACDVYWAYGASSAV